MTLALTVPAWTAHAACTPEDAHLFHSESHGSGITADEREAKAICAGCPVVTACLAYCLEQESRFVSETRAHGVWGGLTAFERTRLRRPPH